VQSTYRFRAGRLDPTSRASGFVCELHTTQVVVLACPLTKRMTFTPTTSGCAVEHFKDHFPWLCAREVEGQDEKPVVEIEAYFLMKSLPPAPVQVAVVETMGLDWWKEFGKFYSGGLKGIRVSVKPKLQALELGCCSLDKDGTLTLHSLEDPASLGEDLALHLSNGLGTQVAGRFAFFCRPMTLYSFIVKQKRHPAWLFTDGNRIFLPPRLDDGIRVLVRAARLSLPREVMLRHVMQLGYSRTDEADLRLSAMMPQLEAINGTEYWLCENAQCPDPGLLVCSGCKGRPFVRLRGLSPCCRSLVLLQRASKVGLEGSQELVQESSSIGALGRSRISFQRKVYKAARPLSIVRAIWACRMSGTWAGWKKKSKGFY
jgi:hypothetical protein